MMMSGIHATETTMHMWQKCDFISSGTFQSGLLTEDKAGLNCVCILLNRLSGKK